MSSTGPWDKLVPGQQHVPRPPSTMETTAPHSGCPTWGLRVPPAQAGQPW